MTMMHDPEEVPQANYQGKFKGYVRDAVDPENRGRLRCYCPQVMGTVDDKDHWTGWAMPCLPWMGGVNTLDFGSPQPKSITGVEAGVWLEFEGGNPDFPIWVGTFIPAPTVDDPNAQQDLAAAAGDVGGSIVQNPPSGSDTADINPLKPQPAENETRMVVKKGRELTILSDQGGSITVGAYGVSIQGLAITINGVVMNASKADGVFK